jgi:hypothetical protein
MSEVTNYSQSLIHFELTQEQAVHISLFTLPSF